MTAADSSAVALVQYAERAEVSAGPTCRLDYLDSIRGLAAVYVVMSHVLLLLDRTQLTGFAWLTGRLVENGRMAVAVFIVLSGFCLAMPSARAGVWRIRGGFAAYICRRARRIYPPYLAALALSLFVLWIVPEPIQARSGYMQSFSPAFNFGCISSHILLIHNVSNDWIVRINPPMWSVATEWQIYFLLPIVLLALGRIGVLFAVVVCTTIALTPIYLFRTFEEASPWFLSLFAMGAWAAFRCYPAGPPRPQPNHRWLNLAFALGLIATFGYCVCRDPLAVQFQWKANLFGDLVIGATASVGLVLLVDGAGPTARAVRKALKVQALQKLGAMSYSLYLTHVVVLVLFAITAMHYAEGWSASSRFWLALPCCVALSTAFAWVFYLLFERPFLRRTGPLASQ